MSILNREDFFAKLHDHMGTSSSDEDIEFMEDMTDTYNELSRQAEDNGADWQRKYNELDKAWREKYRHRFFNSPSINNPNQDSSVIEQSERAEKISLSDIFK